MPTTTFFNLPEEKRQNLIDCALDEFAVRDYDSASISQIVARAGIAKGSLYQYFTDKRELYQYLLELAAAKKGEWLAAATPPHSDQPVFETLRWLLEVMLTFEIRYPKLAQLGFRAAYGKSPLPEDVLQKGRQASMQYFRTLIERGKHRGELRPEVDAPTAAWMLTALLNEMGNQFRLQLGEQAESLPTGELPEQYATEIEALYHPMLSVLEFGLAASRDESSR
jgi:AcrR family transcriptional regulator